MQQDNILEVDGLKVWFPVKKGVFGLVAGYVKAVDGVSFVLKRGETLGIVGESGCGKSTTSRAVLLLNKPTAGTIKIDGTDVRELCRKDPLAYRRKVQVVFQDPNASLNPRHTVLEILTEGMVYHGLCRKQDRVAKAKELLESVGMPTDILERYPHEFSGGQRQRLCIARAIALKPELLICDEAVSALDLTIRAQVLDLLSELKKKLSLSMMFITHDIGVVQHVADRIIVMNRGRIVESGTCDEVLKNPKEEYTRYLMASVPKIGRPLPDAKGPAARQPFPWRRPAELPQPVFEQFVREAESAVGCENADLLKSLDAALNDPGSSPEILGIAPSAAESRFSAWVAGAGEIGEAAKSDKKAAYMAYLSFMHEIEYRKTYGPAMWERKASVVPAPDFLPPNRWQVPARRFGLYRAANRIWNLALIIVVTGLFPMVILPLFGVSMFSNRQITTFAAVFFGVWTTAFALFLAGKRVCSAMRGHPRP